MAILANTYLKKAPQNVYEICTQRRTEIQRCCYKTFIRFRFVGSSANVHSQYAVRVSVRLTALPISDCTPGAPSSTAVAVLTDGISSF